MNNVSVIMPARNAAATISESVRSVLSEPDVAQLVVVDDGSTDGTGGIARRVGDGRLLVLSGPQRGVAAALNAAFDATTCEYVARCDADDVFVPGRLARQLAWLCGHPEYIAISGAFASMTPNGEHIADLAHEGDAREVTDDLQSGKAITSLCTWLTRRDAWERTGGAREWFVTASDVDLQCRLAFEGRVWHEPFLTYRYRLHDQSITHSHSNSRLRFYDHWLAEFARQRLERGSDDLEDGHPPDPPTANLDTGRNAWRSQAVGHLIGRAWAAHGNGDRRKALLYIRQAKRILPFSPRVWKSYLIMKID